MSRVNGNNNDELMLANQDINTDDLEVLHIIIPPPFGPSGVFATNVIVGPGRLRMFEGGEVLEDDTEGVVRTTFYDTSGVPTGSEPVIVSFLSFCEKSSGNSIRDFAQHTFAFPGKGVVFKHGIGYMSEQINGSPTFVAVDGCLYYNRL